HPGECRRAAGTCFKCGQAGHLQKDCKKNTTASTSGQADKKLGALGRVFAITEGHAANTSGTITGTLFIYGHAVFMLFDTGATHSVISSIFASRVTTTPTLLDHVLCIFTPMQDSVRITHVYRNLPLQFDDKIRAINALPLDMCEFDIILGMDWLTEHHATIDCRSYRVIFGDIHTPEFIYHGFLPRKSMQIISALQARTLLSHGCEGFLATIHDTTSDISSGSLPGKSMQIISALQARTLLSHDCEDVFPDELPWIPLVREREYHSIRQTNTETSTEFMPRFLRLAGFLGAAAGTKEEQAKNFQWGLRRSTLNHLMCMSYTDVAQVANTARNYA
nr:putative reverse transcriptase domain-containing protein [Tanacetum cinerariifolium]